MSKYQNIKEIDEVDLTLVELLLLTLFYSY
jgi:hypothetical protein